MRSRVGLLLLLATACPKRVGEGTRADVVVVAKRIYTNDPQFPFATAMVVRDGAIAFIGNEAAALEAASPNAFVDRFPNATIVPGLADAHAHLASLGRAISLVSLSAMKSADEVGARLATATKASYQGEWLLGRGWDQNDWHRKDFPSRKLLDAAMAGVPIVLTRVDGHAAWVSSAALERAGISKNTPDPAGGRILRGSDGEPTGVLIDNAIDLVSSKIPQLSELERERHLKAAIELCAALGLTSVHDAGMDQQTLNILQRWDLGGQLPIRIYAMADGQSEGWRALAERGTTTGGMIELRAVKLLADGALGSRGAALFTPYTDEPSSTGLLLLRPEELEERARLFDQHGFQVAVHAIGDRANSVVLDVLSKLDSTHRHRIEHLQVLRPEDLPRLAQTGLIASMQPTHATSDMPWAESRVGKQRLAMAYAWKSVLDAKVPLAFGSDFPVEDPNPLWGLYAARTRQDHSGQPAGGWLPSQRISGMEALGGFTSGPAYASFAENRRGRLAVGFDADFVVLPIDPIEGDAKDLLSADVQMTVVRGIDVFRRQGK